MKISRRKFLRISTVGAGATAMALWGHDHPTTIAYAASGQNSKRTPIDVPGFDAFKESVKTLTDQVNIYIESNGMPAHSMMTGIRSWQQQVPIPQDYTGNNAWSLPVTPVLAEHPISAKKALYRGAIALAANGVPIFNALNNRGEDAYLAGELDEWGGHAGRADDYHYHMAPLHLQKTVGIDNPIAYALDGFPIYGTTETDGTAVTGLDEFNGHFDLDKHYHYHATTTYPYINGGMRGVVQVREDQIDPQPRTTPIRPFLQPLRGAVITGFESANDSTYSVIYTLNGKIYRVNYSIQGKRYTFAFVDPNGNTRTETYTQR